MTKNKKKRLLSVKRLEESFDHLKSNKVLLIMIALVLMFFVIHIFVPKNYNSYVNGDEDVIVKEKNLAIIHKNGKYIQIDNFRHSFKATKKIIVENTGNRTVFYDVILRGVTNKVRNKSGFTYRIISTDGTKKVKEGKVPAKSSRLFYKEIIKPKSKKVYIIKFNYKRGKTSKKDLFKCYFDVKTHNNSLKNSNNKAKSMKQ